jgi:phosphoglycerate dehydrogenase-like enzyme
MKVVIAEPISDTLMELIEKNSKDWTVYKDSPKDKKELIDRLKSAEAASSYSVKYDEEIFAACPDLKFLAIPAVGAEYFVDMDAASKHGVTVANCPGYNAPAVAEMAIGLAIAAARNVSAEQKNLQKGIWDQPTQGPGLLLSGSNVGIIGNGNVSKAISQLLVGWSASILAANSKTPENHIDKLIESSDVLFICCPLTDKTRGMVTAERISTMKQSTVLVNVARGAVVDEDALYLALKEKRIYGAGLDVFVEEPAYGQPLPESILRFVDLDNVIVSPHLAGTSVQSRVTLGQMIYISLAGWIEGNSQTIPSL